MSKNIKKLLHQVILLASITMLFNIFFMSIVFAAANMEGIQVYQKNLRASPAHMQKLADDISRYRNADNLWDVLREEFSLPHYEENPAVQDKIEWFMNNQDFLLRSASRSAPYLYYILQQVKKRHLPTELVLLPIIESGYNPFNRSPVGAVGIWQLMPDTASGLGVKQDWWYDGRRDVIASTRAALNYLAYLQTFFEGNWLYAIAAYNTGEGNVLAAIKKNIRDGRDTNFWSLPVAQQTKDYVPSLLALAIIISHPEQYPIYFPPVRNAPYLAQVDVGRQINLKYAAKLAGISYQKLIQLNPGFSKQAVFTKGQTKIVLPIENVEEFTTNLASTPFNQEMEWLHYRAKPGETLVSVAKKFNTSITAIKQLNHLSKNNLRHSINLLVPNNEKQNSTNDDEKSFVVMSPSPQKATLAAQDSDQPSSLNIDRSKKYTLQPGDTIYMVRSTDTLASIAQRFHLAAEDLIAANGLAHKKISTGNELIIPTHLASLTSVKNLLPGDTIYMVRAGDTIEKIAAKFHSSPSAIRLANLIDNNSLIEGEKIVVPTHFQG